MSLDYKRLESFPVIGTVAYTKQNDKVTNATAVWTAWPLTASYRVENPTLPLVTTKTFRTAGFAKINLDLSYTMGLGETGNSFQLKIEQSSDGINFYRIPNESVSSGTSTLTQREFTFVGTVNAGNSTISIGLDIFYRFMRVSAKETIGGSTFGTLTCEATLAGL